MEYMIRNAALRVTISSEGGELMSVKTLDGTEFMWQGDPAYWKKRAPHCFPVVGRLTGGKCTMDGKLCAMDTHGFFRWRQMEPVEHREDRLTLKMESDQETLAGYPCKWEVRLTYVLDGECLRICFAVENKDCRPMWFSYGGHPGFRVPLEQGLAFEDYCLRFGGKCAPVRVGMTDACFVGGPDTPLVLENGDTLPLRHNLFDRDAVVLKQMADTVALCSPKGAHSVTVHYPGMKYLGLWHAPETEAPYVCVEPWTDIPSRQDVVEELAQKPDIIRLDPGGCRRNEWTITYH